MTANPILEAAIERLTAWTHEAIENCFTDCDAIEPQDVRDLLADHATQAARIAELVKAASEGLICAEADLEARRQSCVEYGEDPQCDQFYQVFKARRDLIKDALAPFADRVAGEENNLPRCEDCGAPEGMDCRTVQGRIPPHLSRVLALSAPPAAVAEQTMGEG